MFWCCFHLDFTFSSDVDGQSSSFSVCMHACVSESFWDGGGVRVGTRVWFDLTILPDVVHVGLNSGTLSCFQNEFVFVQDLDLRDRNMSLADLEASTTAVVRWDTELHVHRGGSLCGALWFDNKTSFTNSWTCSLFPNAKVPVAKEHPTCAGINTFAHGCFWNSVAVEIPLPWFLKRADYELEGARR